MQAFLQISPMLSNKGEHSGFEHLGKGFKSDCTSISSIDPVAAPCNRNMVLHILMRVSIGQCRRVGRNLSLDPSHVCASPVSHRMEGG